MVLNVYRFIQMSMTSKLMSLLIECFAFDFPKFHQIRNGMIAYRDAMREDAFDPWKKYDRYQQRVL